MRWAEDGWMVESGQYQRSTRGRLPSWYSDQPPPLRSEGFYLSAFNRLSTERQFPGNGFGPIPWSKIDDYARRKGLDERMTDVFVDTILLLDSGYREHVKEEHERQNSREARQAEKKAKEEAARIGGRKKRSARNN